MELLEALQELLEVLVERLDNSGTIGGTCGTDLSTGGSTAHFFVNFFPLLGQAGGENKLRKKMHISKIELFSFMRMFDCLSGAEPWQTELDPALVGAV